MAKKVNYKEASKNEVVRIRKLKTNYELRYNYLKVLTEFIKRLPREHRGVKVENVMDPNTGKPKDEWIRIIRDVEMGKIISFMIDNSIKFVFENLTDNEINFLRQEYKAKLQRIHEAMKAKADALDVVGEDYSFLKIQPFEYQKKDIKFFEINNGIAILGSQPGIGKSLSALAYAAKHKLKTLIICPSPLKFNWKNEIMKFSHEKAFVYKFKPKKGSKDIAYTKEESLFHIINYESLTTYVKLEYKHKCSGRMVKLDGKNVKCDWEAIDLVKKHPKCPNCENTGTLKSRVHDVVFFSDKGENDLKPEDYDLIVLDECHRAKSLDALVTKVIRKAFRDIIPKKLLLSGTAIKNRPVEFYATLSFLDPKEWNSFHDFGVRYGAGYEDIFGWNYDGASNLEELYERISPYFIRRLKSDVLKELPPKTFTDIPIELTDEEERNYNKNEKEIIKQIVDGVETEKKESSLVKIHKLKKITSNIKFDRVIEIIQDIIDADEKVVVFSEYVDVAKKIHEHFKHIAVLHTGEQNDIEKQEAVDNFQNKKEIKIFSGMVIASATGLTLTASNKLIFIGFPWSYADYEQACDRIHRASSKHENIQIITMFCKNTIDEDIYELIKEKAQVMSKVLDNKNFKHEVSVSDENIFSSLIKRLKDK